MKITVHNKFLTELSKLLETDVEDCAGWIEDFLQEVRGDEEDGELFEKVGDNLYPEQVGQISQMLLEHYSKEGTVTRGKVSGLLYNLKTT